MGIPTSEEITSLKQLLEIATTQGKELIIREREEKRRATLRKAEELIRKTLTKRTKASDYTAVIFGSANIVPLNAWKVQAPVTSTDEVFTMYLQLANDLRLVYTSSKYRSDSPIMQTLVFHIKRAGYYTSWDKYHVTIKPCGSWDEFCKTVASHGKNGTQLEV